MSLNVEEAWDEAMTLQGLLNITAGNTKITGKPRKQKAQELKKYIVEMHRQWRTLYYFVKSKSLLDEYIEYANIENKRFQEYANIKYKELAEKK